MIISHNSGIWKPAFTLTVQMTSPTVGEIEHTASRSLILYSLYVYTKPLPLLFPGSGLAGTIALLVFINLYGLNYPSTVMSSIVTKRRTKSLCIGSLCITWGGYLVSSISKQYDTTKEKHLYFYLSALSLLHFNTGPKRYGQKFQHVWCPYMHHQYIIFSLELLS